jgi:acetylornithine deacetylase/succinyl-diaminopimelate desuccinylase-like protein
MNDIQQYISIHKDRFLSELFELLRIPSISSSAANKTDMRSAAEWWCSHLLAIGAQRAQVYETTGHPVVYAEKIVNPNFPTVLVYAHMDVMPVDPLDLWHSRPFEPEVRNGRIYARGADDDKGQSFIHAKAFEYLVSHNLLSCNVKFLIEGEEEIGSTALPAFCQQYADMLRCDVILVSDTGMIAPNVPAITTGLRGLAYWQVEVTGPNRDLHSGIFGGAVANPINVLSKLIAQMVDANGRITIPGFYDDVMDLSAEEREQMAKAPYNEADYMAALGVKALNGEWGYSTIERTGIRPSFDVCGIWGGYTGDGAKTVLPSKAFAKISSRLVPNQDYRKIARLFESHFAALAPDYVTVKVESLHGGHPYVCPTSSLAYGAASKACADVFGKEPVPVRSGGSIPIITTFEEILGVKTVLLGFGLESDAIHSPNENFPIEQLFKGIETVVRFYHHFKG